MYWLRAIFRQKELRKEINEYISWRFPKYPTTTASHKEWLYKFGLASGKPNVKCILHEDILAFINSLQAQYARGEASKAIYSFLSFHGIGEMVDVETKAVLVIQRKKGRPVNMRLVKRVKFLKDSQRMSYRQIQKELIKEEDRRYEISQLHTWHHYPLEKSGEV